MTGWLETVRARGPAEVGVAFDLAYDTRGTGFLSPCPACGAERQHPKHRDPRPAIGLRRDGRGWQCHACDRTGDAVTLAALVAIGRVPAKGDLAWRDVRRACAAVGLCEGDPSDVSSPHVPLRPVPPSRPAAPPRRPPADEVAELWDACVPVVDDPGVAGWLRSRGLSPEDVADRDLLRALPEHVLVPPWAWFKGRTWPDSGHRAVVPMYGANGALASLHARRVVECEPKAASPAGYAIAGLVMADPLARLLLAGEPLGDGGAAADLVKRAGVWIGEGVPDYLTLATEWSDADEAAPAVLGVIAGGWTPEIAARVPDGTTVTVAPHPDDAGEGYFDKVVSTLAARMRTGAVKVKRWNGGKRSWT